MSIPKVPVKSESAPNMNDIRSWPLWRIWICKHVLRMRLSILIGTDCPNDYVRSKSGVGLPGEPCALKYSCGGWLIGPTCKVEGDFEGCVNFLDGRCDELQNQIKSMYENEFTDSHASKNEMSREDKTVERLFDTECELVDGHFQIPLPWKDGIEDLPNNREMAAHRLSSLKKRLQRDPTLFGKYNQLCQVLYQRDMLSEYQTIVVVGNELGTYRTTRSFIQRSRTR